jgi:hypothetical protein
LPYSVACFVREAGLPFLFLFVAVLGLLALTVVAMFCKP